MSVDLQVRIGKVLAVCLCSLVMCGVTGCPGKPAGARYAGRYVSEKFPNDVTELRPDSTFVVKIENRSLTGIYSIEGNVLKLGLPNGKGNVCRIDESGITDDRGGRWLKQM